MKFQYLAEHERQYVIRKACRSLGISRSGFYAYRTRTPSNRQLENEFLSGKIRALFEQHSGRYGAKRITHCLKDEGIKINRKRVAHLMRAMRLVAKGARRAYRNCSTQHTRQACPNLIQQDGIAIHRNEVWLGDILNDDGAVGSGCLSARLRQQDAKVRPYRTHRPGVAVHQRSLYHAAAKQRSNSLEQQERQSV